MPSLPRFKYTPHVLRAYTMLVIRHNHLWFLHIHRPNFRPTVLLLRLDENLKMDNLKAVTYGKYRATWVVMGF